MSEELKELKAGVSAIAQDVGLLKRDVEELKGFQLEVARDAAARHSGAGMLSVEEVQNALLEIKHIFQKSWDGEDINCKQEKQRLVTKVIEELLPSVDRNDVSQVCLHIAKLVEGVFLLGVRASQKSGKWLFDVGLRGGAKVGIKNGDTFLNIPNASYANSFPVGLSKDDSRLYRTIRAFEKVQVLDVEQGVSQHVYKVLVKRNGSDEVESVFVTSEISDLSKVPVGLCLWIADPKMTIPEFPISWSVLLLVETLGRFASKEMPSGKMKYYYNFKLGACEFYYECGLKVDAFQWARFKEKKNRESGRFVGTGKLQQSGAMRKINLEWARPADLRPGEELARDRACVDVAKEATMNSKIVALISIGNGCADDFELDTTLSSSLREIIEVRNTEGAHYSSSDSGVRMDDVCECIVMLVNWTKCWVSEFQRAWSSEE